MKDEACIYNAVTDKDMSYNTFFLQSVRVQVIFVKIYIFLSIYQKIILWFKENRIRNHCRNNWLNICRMCIIIYTFIIIILNDKFIIISFISYYSIIDFSIMIIAKKKFYNSSSDIFAGCTSNNKSI